MKRYKKVKLLIPDLRKILFFSPDVFGIGQQNLAAKLGGIFFRKTFLVGKVCPRPKILSRSTIPSV